MQTLNAVIKIRPSVDTITVLKESTTFIDSVFRSHDYHKVPHVMSNDG